MMVHDFVLTKQLSHITLSYLQKFKCLIIHTRSSIPEIDSPGGPRYVETKQSDVPQTLSRFRWSLVS